MNPLSLFLLRANLNTVEVPLLSRPLTEFEVDDLERQREFGPHCFSSYFSVQPEIFLGVKRKEAEKVSIRVVTPEKDLWTPDTHFYPIRP